MSEKPAYEIRLASGPSDLENLSTDVFDFPVQDALWSEFLGDARHHLALAVTGEGTVVGMASAVHYVHPDKPAELWINEVGVAEPHWRRGLASRLLDRLFRLARDLGCHEAWVLTEPENEGANALYLKAGGEPSPSVMYSFELDQA